MADTNFKPSDTKRVLQVADIEIEHEDVFHLKNLYALTHEWFMENGFANPDKAGLPDAVEKYYFQKEMDGGLTEHAIWWRLHKVPDDHGYLKYFVTFDFQTIAMSSKKVQHKGKQVKTNKGDLIIRCRAYLVLDYKDEWKTHWFLKYFHTRFINVWYKKEIEAYKQRLWLLMYDLQSTIKQYLQLKNPVEMQKPFHPERGL